MAPKLSSGLVCGILVTLVAFGRSASTLKPRYNNPPDRVGDWVALGDSFSAGPGAGEEYDPNKQSGDCMRRDKAYAPTLQRDTGMIGPGGPGLGKPRFRFASCTGDTTANLLDFSDPENNQLNQVHDETTFATLSIGGNDVLFADILQVCVYGATLKSIKKTCKQKMAESQKEMYSKDFHARYNHILDQLISQKFKWTPETHDTSVIYQTSYIQFFDDFTDQCDGKSFLEWYPKAPKLKKDLRRSLNLVVHELNEVLQYWIDLRNALMSKYLSKKGEMNTYVSPIHWIDVDWRYMDHRFCRDGVEEPDRKNEDTWFFHSPNIPVPDNQKENETYLDLFANNYPITWRPGRPGEPKLNDEETEESEEAPFDPNNPVHLLASEKTVRTFHPKPAGFAAEAEELKAALYRRNNQLKLPDKRFKILCIGDFSALGEGYDHITPDRYGFISYLHGILMTASNFGNKPVMHDFIGSQKTGFAGDVGHEIYPDGRWYRDIAHWAASSSEFQASLGKVVPIMMGAKDLQHQTPVNDILEHVHWLLSEVWKFDPTATVLLASAPMMGDIRDDGSEWYVSQKAIIEYNAQLAQIANYYARHKKRIVYVHLSPPQRLRLKLNPYVPNTEGYHRIAYDFLNGMIQANERGFFDGDQWDATVTDVERPSYELLPLKDNEVTDGVKCHQRRGSSAPDYDTVTKALFRGAKDQDDWINNYACKKEFVCKFTWDAETFDSSAQYPFSNGKTCITAGGDGSTHLTVHQFVVRREHLEDDLGNWCKDNLREILDRCVKDGHGYGGYWGDGKRAIHLSNVRYRDDDVKKVSSVEAQKSWRDNYPPYEEAMQSIKNGGPPLFKPDKIPGDVEIADPWSPPKPVSYATWDPNGNSPPSEPSNGASKSLQIIYETFVSEGVESWQKWHFFEGKPQQAVDPCSDNELFSVDDAPRSKGYDPPWINVKNKSFRPSGYAQDCIFEGLDGKGSSGDVGWLHCPERPAIMCLEDPKKAGGKGAWKNCDKGLWTRDRIPVAYCDWE